MWLDKTRIRMLIAFFLYLSVMFLCGACSTGVTEAQALAEYGETAPGNNIKPVPGPSIRNTANPAYNYYGERPLLPEVRLLRMEHNDTIVLD